MPATRREVITVVPTLQGADEGADRDWLASIPEVFTAREGFEAADRAVRFARKSIRDVAWNYHGTAPPPPWPAHEALQKALANMEKVRDFFEVVQEKLEGSGKEAKFPRESTTIKTGPALIKYGRELYAEVGRLQGWSAKAVTVDDMLKMVPRPGTILFGLSATAIAGLAVAAYVVSPNFRALVRRFA